MAYKEQIVCMYVYISINFDTTSESKYTYIRIVVVSNQYPILMWMFVYLIS